MRKDSRQNHHLRLPRLDQTLQLLRIRNPPIALFDAPKRHVCAGAARDLVQGAVGRVLDDDVVVGAEEVVKDEEVGEGGCGRDEDVGGGEAGWGSGGGWGGGGGGAAVGGGGHSFNLWILPPWHRRKDCFCDARAQELRAMGCAIAEGKVRVDE